MQVEYGSGNEPRLSFLTTTGTFQNANDASCAKQIYAETPNNSLHGTVAVGCDASGTCLVVLHVLVFKIMHCALC